MNAPETAPPWAIWTPPATDGDDFCAAMLPKVSRSFALSISLLPDALRVPVRTGYLLCRVLDTIEDEADMAPSLRERLFDAFDLALDGGPGAVHAFVGLARSCLLGDVLDERTLSWGSADVFADYQNIPEAARAAMRGPILEMSRGMREHSLRAGPLADLPGLERYCHFVAGTVGALLTDLFLWDCPLEDPAQEQALRDQAEHFGIGLQLVNILKDVAGDLERGVTFLPQDALVDAGLKPIALLEPAHREAGLRIVASLCHRARVHLDAAVDYTLTWPAASATHVRLFCAVPLGLAFATLDEVEHGHDTLRRGRVPKVSRAVVASVLGGAQQVLADDDALRALITPPALHMP